MRQLWDLRLTRDMKIAWLMTIVIAGFFSSVTFYYFRDFVFNPTAPVKAFLPQPDVRFGDFWSTINAWKTWQFAGINPGLSYFPATYLITQIFVAINDFGLNNGTTDNLPFPYVYTLVFVPFCFAYCAWGLRSDLKSETFLRAFVMTAMSYPVLFTIHTGNFEAFVFICITLFFYLFQTGRYRLSTLPLAMAISMKLFPAVFVVMYLCRRRYREIAYTGLYCFALTLLPLLIFRGGIRQGIGNYLKNFHASQNIYLKIMILDNSGCHFGHSLLNGTRSLLLNTSNDLSRFIPSILMPYFCFTLVFFAALALYIILIERVFWKQAALLVLAMCLLPFTSTDYKLMHFMIPLFLFINAEKSEKSEKFDAVYLVLFAFLFIPKTYFDLHGDPSLHEADILNPLVMLAMLLLIVGSGLKQASLFNPTKRNLGLGGLS